ncbi:sodium/potassium/calcium exchanger 4-like [Thraustotheca clavata]|uniref:Sodium/potassium/calcium exchanger 4-like n=1 Tax=Thraustotheca clavata TaxID=74557 RepID=A0A1V9ZPJ7_9STRA|nr:sodium/potassium/calcium exchanger 4-like [Thraustotheca clavata]
MKTALLVLLGIVAVNGQGNGTVVEQESIGIVSLNAILSVAGLLYIFLGLAIVCDDYLVPAIETLCEKLKIPEEAAGASFLAFGSAAPEILLNAVATAEGQLESMESSLSAIQGSAIIAFALIPSLCALVAPNGLVVSWGPMVRDSLVYIVSLGLLVRIMTDSAISVKESTMLCSVYVIYMLMIFVPIWSRSRHPTEGDDKDTFVMPSGKDAHMIDQALHPNHSVLPTLPTTYGSLDASYDTPPSNRCLEFVLQVLDIISRPYRLLFAYTLPECNTDSPTRHYYPVTLVLSIAYVALFSAGALVLTRILSTALHLSTTVAGVTLLALGAQIPDAIASVALARAGHADAAVCNAIGSQVINVTLGSGFPWLIYTIFHDIIDLPFQNETILWKWLAAIIVAYLALNFRSILFACCTKSKGFFVGLSPRDGLALLFVYLVCNVYLIATL